MSSRNGEIESATRFYRFGEFELDVYDEILRSGGEKLPINHRMFQVLLLLVERRGDIITKDEFFEKVWDGSFVEENNLTVAVTALRKVLHDDPKKARFIENLPRRGYRFIAPVSFGESSTAGEATLNVPQTSVNAEARPPVRRDSRIVFGILATCLLLALLLVSFGGFFSRTASNGRSVDSIAVLPFESRDADSEYMSDGLTDGIINNLSRMSNVRVIDRNSASQFKNKTTDALAAGRKLDVDAVLTGRIEQTDNSLIVTAELTNVVSNKQLWRQQFKRDRNELFVVQQEIVQAIAKELPSGTGGQDRHRLAKRPTENPKAYDLYLKGRYYWNKRNNDDFRRSLDLFRAAIDEDPTFAHAYVGLANTYSLIDLSHHGISDDERIVLAKGAIQKALEIDPTISEAYAASGINKVYRDWDFAGAENDYRRALELNPNDATAHHWYAELLSMVGRFDESFQHYDQARVLDPLSLPIRTDMAFAHYYAHDFDTAIENLNQAKELNPENERTYIYLVYAYREKGMFKESIDSMENQFALQLRQGGRNRENYDKVMRYAGDLRNGLTNDGPNGYWQMELKSSPAGPIYQAVAYSKLGETDRAFDSLEKALNDKNTGMVWLKVMPDLDTLRADPRYQTLLERVGFRLD